MIAWSSPPARSAAQSRGRAPRKQTTLSGGLDRLRLCQDPVLMQFGP